MHRSLDKRLLIILALLLAIAPFQTAMSSFEDLSDHSPAPSMMSDMENADHGCNTDDCCNTASCTTASCSLCSVVPALIPSFSFTLSNVTAAHQRHSDTNLQHWITTPPFRPPWS